MNLKKIKLYFMLGFVFINILPQYVITIDNNLKELKIDFENKLIKIPAWMKKQISNDFLGVAVETFNITPKVLNHYNNMPAIRITINEGELSVHRSNWFQHNKWQSWAEVRALCMIKGFNMLNSITVLPDADFLVYLWDCFGPYNPGSPSFFPILGPAKDRKLNNNVILIPDFHFVEIYPKLISEVEEANELYPWSEKFNKAIWRGASNGVKYDLSESRHVRLKLVETASLMPELIDAKFNHVGQGGNIRPYLMKFTGNRVSIRNHIKFKYQLAIDGNGPSYPGTYWRQFANCAVIKNISDGIQWYYEALQPYEHYIPVKSDFTDLKDKIIWCQDHDEELQKIAANTNNFAKNNLQLVDNLLYVYLVIKEISYRQIKDS